MTRKDYEMVARALRAAIVEKTGLVGAVMRLADEFARDNPSFNRNKFFDMTGIVPIGLYDDNELRGPRKRREQ